MASRRAESGTIDLERAIDRLYRLPLGDFVAARNELAVRLRKAGNAQEAARVKALEKPSVTAWALNQVWWADRHAFQRLIETGNRLRADQRASLSGEAANLRAAVEARQAAISEVVDLAVRAMGGGELVGPAMRQRLAATCDALATGEPVGAAGPGRLARDLAPTGLGALSALLSVTSDARGLQKVPSRIPAVVTPFRGKPEAAQRLRDTALASARSLVKERQTIDRDVERQLREKVNATRDAERTYGAAQRQVADLDRRLAEAMRGETSTKAALIKARQEESLATEARQRAAQALVRARADLEHASKARRT